MIKIYGLIDYNNAHKVDVQIIKMDIEINIIYNKLLQIKNYKIYKISNKITKFTKFIIGSL